METLIFWIGALVGLFLVMLLYSLLAMAQEADKFYDELENSKITVTPVDAYYLAAQKPYGRPGAPKWPPEKWQNCDQKLGHV